MKINWGKILDNVLLFIFALTIVGSINYAIQCAPIPECGL